MLDEQMRHSLIELLGHKDTDHRIQGAALTHALGRQVARQLFEAPRILDGRPNVSFIDGYILMPEVISAWIGQSEWLTPWCSELKELDLSGQMRLTSIDMLAPLASLERLDLRSCVRINNIDGLTSLRKLNWLRIASCRNVTDLPSLETCEELRYLDLGGCAKIKTLDPLKNHPNLREINLVGLPLERLETSFGTTESKTGKLEVLLSLPKLRRVHVGRVWGTLQQSVDELRRLNLEVFQS